MTQRDPNHFKIIYENLDQKSLEHVTAIRGAAHALSSLYSLNNREMYEAMMRLEESVMWAIKSVCVMTEVRDVL